MFGLIPFERRNYSLLNWPSIFDDFERAFFSSTIPVSTSSLRTDVIDRGDKFVLQAELPGFAKEDINIDISGDRLTISAKQEKSSEDKTDNYIRQERRYGAYSRSFDITGIDADAIKASYQNGILEVSLPKREVIAENTRKVEIQ